MPPIENPTRPKPPAKKRRKASPAPGHFPPLRVLFVTPECAPLAKTGGLGDVSAALPPALRAIGVDARVLVPGYPAVIDADPGAKLLARFPALGWHVRLLESQLAGGVPLYVLACPELYARRGGPYQSEYGEDWTDNAARFGVLSRVAATLAGADSPLDWRPDVVHCNDWQCALAPLYLRFGPRPRAASLLTIHNLAFQGIFEAREAPALELPPESLGIDGVEYYGHVSFLKGGLIFCDAISTVSPTYAREIQTAELGFGLEGVLRLRSQVLTGVLNGIDTAMWNPVTDPWIPARYGPKTLERKLANKRALKERLGLAGDNELPLAAMVTRLTQQKGVDLLAAAVDALVGLPAQLVVVGSGSREMAEKLRALEARHPGNVAVFIGFDEALAHLVEAGADMFLMPSRFEPCGMNQMYSQRYGTPPVANATGGLIDTIVDEGHAHPPEKATGFLMHGATSEELIEAMRRAVAAWHDHRRWRALQHNGMARDFGWSSAALAYVAIYRRIMGGIVPLRPATIR